MELNVHKLREADVELAKCRTVLEDCKQLVAYPTLASITTCPSARLMQTAREGASCPVSQIEYKVSLKQCRSVW